MKQTTNNLPPIPVDYIVGHAMTLETNGKRRPFIDLISEWADHEDMKDEGMKVVTQITGRPAIDADHMPHVFYSRYRDPERAAQLIEIVRNIDLKISQRDHPWTWAFVMRVMIDDNIILAETTVNNFDVIISSMIPGKGKDCVRKNGDYKIVLKRNESYHGWTDIAHIHPVQASNHETCRQIAEMFMPILSRSDTPKPST